MIQPVFERMSPLQRSIVSALVGLLGYGAWAYIVNSMHGMSVAIKAACVQGGYSFALTFIMTLIIESLFRSLSRMISAPKTTQTLTVFITCGVLFSSSWWVNAMAGTPEIFNTVILGYVIGTIYTTSYVLSLAKGQAKTQNL